jgi:outer membrane protein OmpA-like peptidoglycan-associated protein
MLMRNLKYSFILALAIFCIFSLFGLTKWSWSLIGQEEEEITIPPDAHKKAIQALKALGPTRGAKTIDYRVVSILGITRGIEAKSEKIKATLDDLRAKETETEYQIELSGDVLFDFDKWDIRPEAEEMLKKVGEVITIAESSKVIISGHTDSKGSDEYNQGLSEKRAESVKNWLVKNSGVDSKLIETIGYGESKPVAPNTNPDGLDNPEGRQKNRRVEIVIKKK